jgi:Glycosyl transferases group 1
MIHVNILAPDFSRFRPAPGHWMPWQFSSRILKEMGIKITFHRSHHPGITDCDILIISSLKMAPMNTLGHTAETRDQALERLSGYYDQTCVIWSDESDSTGTTQFEVWPYIDRYWKKQVLRDRTLYNHVYSSGRLHFDWWRDRMGIEDTPGYVLADNSDLFDLYSREYPDEAPRFQQPVQAPKDLDEKLRISWNLGYHDWRRGKYMDRIKFQFIDRARMIIGLPHKLEFIHDPNRDRSIDLIALLGAWGKRPPTFAREMAVNRVESMIDVNTFTSKTRKHRKVYLECLKSSKLNLSVFGLGEICYRDFETFCAGSTLVMTDMSHLETFPDFYKSWVTYAPIRWDYTDLEDVTRKLLGNPKLRERIASEGQRRYLDEWSPNGMRRFASRLRDLLQEARCSYEDRRSGK